MQAVSTKPIPRVERLKAAGAGQRDSAIAIFLFGALLAATEVLLFDWSVRETIGGALLGICVWGAVYLWQQSDLMPRGVLQEAPAGIEVEPGGIDFSSRGRLILVATGLLPLAWLADRFDLGGVFIPGQSWGQAAAALVGLVRIRRWERTNGRRVVYDPDADTTRPYAGPPR